MNELIAKGLRKEITPEERAEYMTKFADALEKKLNKPFWEYTEYERLVEIVVRENREVGNLTGDNCEFCKNKGWIARIKDGYILYSTCKCMGKRDIQNGIKRSGLESMYSTYRLENYRTDYAWQRDAKQKVTSFYSNGSKCFMALGQSGSGKTHLCVALAEILARSGMQVKFMNWVEESTKIKQLVNDFYLYDDIVDSYKKAEVLFIDDLFKTQGGTLPTQADIRLAYEIINHRYNMAKSGQRCITIVSSELSPQRLGQVDEAIAGRLLEMALKNVVWFDGKDKNQRMNIGVDK